MEGQFVSTLVSLYNDLLANIALNIWQTNFIHYSSTIDNMIMVSKNFVYFSIVPLNSVKQSCH